MKTAPGHLLTALALLCAALLPLPGCGNTQPEAGGGTTTYRQITGDLYTTVEAPVDRVWGATQAAIEELQFHSVNKRKDALTGILDAKTADNSGIQVRVEQRTQNTTDINVSVGPFGREATARLVLEKIKSRL